MSWMENKWTHSLFWDHSVNLEMLVRENPSRLTVCETQQQSWQVQSHLNPSFAPLWHLHPTSPSHLHLFHRPECNELQACDWPILATVHTGFSFLLRFNLNFGSTCLRPPVVQSPTCYRTCNHLMSFASKLFCIQRQSQRPASVSQGSARAPQALSSADMLLNWKLPVCQHFVGSL